MSIIAIIRGRWRSGSDENGGAGYESDRLTTSSFSKYGGVSISPHKGQEEVELADELYGYGASGLKMGSGPVEG